MKLLLSLLAVTFLTCVGCSSGPRAKIDTAAYLANMPKSIVVIQPLNLSVQARAPEIFLSTITEPLAEQGYYVFPVAIVDTYLKENGLPTAGEMHQVSPKKFAEVFGADAVLYIQIKTWTTTYMVIDSTSVVDIEYRLVDTRTSKVLWTSTQAVKDSSSDGQLNPYAMIMTAGFHAATNEDNKHERKLARIANSRIIQDPNDGMLIGPRHPHYKPGQPLRQ